MPIHVTGSARSEGYYKIDMKEKVKYVEYMKRQLQPHTQTSSKDDDKVKALINANYFPNYSSLGNKRQL